MNSLRTFATAAKATPSRLRSRGKTPLGLDHFIQRQRALALWRDILRSVAAITHDGMQQDMRAYARAEFERHRHITDLGHIRYLISVRLILHCCLVHSNGISLQTGKTQFDTMKGTLINSGILTEL